jgi:hypothetical protein
MERNATKEKSSEGFPIAGAPLGSRAARLPWNASVTSGHADSGMTLDGAKIATYDVNFGFHS